jgi:ankyrin repeat protein
MGLGMEEKLKNYMKDANPLAFGDNRRLYWLQICAEGGRNDLVKYLLSRGANPDTNDGAPLKLAVIHGNLDVVKTLIEAGANPNHPEALALFSALVNNNYDIAEFLLESGAKMIQAWQNLLGEEALKYPLLSKYYKNKRS